MSSLLEQLPKSKEDSPKIVFTPYKDETEMSDIMNLVQVDFSEPYNIYTYRYFIHNWPQLCFLAREGVGGSICGAIVCKLDAHKKVVRRGYIAMLAVDKQLRKQGIGKELVRSYSLNTIRDTLI